MSRFLPESFSNLLYAFLMTSDTPLPLIHAVRSFDFARVKLRKDCQHCHRELLHNGTDEAHLNKIKKVLDVWGEFLRSPASSYVLGDSPTGWFGETGIKSVEDVLNLEGTTHHSFEEAFQCDGSAVHYGFTSWDHFFTRLFRDGIRSVGFPRDDDFVVNCCDSKVYKIGRNVKTWDKFWIKGQHYPILAMLAFYDLAQAIVG